MQLRTLTGRDVSVKILTIHLNESSNVLTQHLNARIGLTLKFYSNYYLRNFYEKKFVSLTF